MKNKRFGSVKRNGDEWLVEIFEAVRPVAGYNVPEDEIDSFLANNGVYLDAVITDERKVRSDS